MDIEAMKSLRDTAASSNMVAEEALRKVVEVMRENTRMREALEKIQKLTDDIEGDTYDDLDAMQAFENRVSDIVEIALARAALSPAAEPENE